MLLLLHGLNINDALDDWLDELGGEVSPWLLGGVECCSVWCDLVSPLPIHLWLMSSPCSVGVSLLMVSGIEDVPGFLGLSVLEEFSEYVQLP